MHVVEQGSPARPPTSWSPGSANMISSARGISLPKQIKEHHKAGLGRGNYVDAQRVVSLF